MLRTGLLTGRTLLLAGTPASFAEALTPLDATVRSISPPPVGANMDLTAADTLVVDARGWFAAAGGGYEGVRAAVDGAFAVVRDVAVASWIPAEAAGDVARAAAGGTARAAADGTAGAAAGGTAGAAGTVMGETAAGAARADTAAGGGQVILIAPAPGAGAFAEAARAALENLARTLSTEWARHGVTAVALLPGDATPDAALAELVGWLASPAGAYLSGTALRLDV